MKTWILHMNAKGKIDQYLQVNPPLGRLQKVNSYISWAHMLAHFTLVGQFLPDTDIKVRIGPTPLNKLGDE